MSEASSSLPLREWASGLLDRVEAEHGGAADHPSEIVGRPVTINDAIDMAREAFLALVAVVGEAGSSIRVHLVADFDVEGAGTTSPADLNVPFLRTALADDMSISVGASAPEATFEGWEVEEVPISQSIVHVPDGRLRACLRRIRYPGDDAWTMSGEIVWERARAMRTDPRKAP